MSKEPQQQPDNSPADRIKAWQYKKGQSGNPGGRPKGTISLKAYARKHLESMTDEQKEEFMNGLNKDTIWKMAEGNPKQDNTTEVKMDSSLIGLIKGNNEPEATD